MRKFIVALALGLLLVGLKAGTVSGETKALEEVSSFSYDVVAPDLYVSDLTWDGEHLWATDPNHDKIYEIDTGGNLISSFGVDSDIPFGLAWDGEYLWVDEYKSPPKIFEYDTSGNLISSFDFGPCRGMTWDEAYLWVTTLDEIYKLDTGGNVISSFNPPSSSPRGLAWDGEHFWVSDGAERRIYSLRVTTDNEVPSYT